MATLADRDAWAAEDTIPDPWTGIVKCRVWVEEPTDRRDEKAEASAVMRARPWLGWYEYDDVRVVAVIVAIECLVWIHTGLKCKSELDAKLIACEEIQKENRKARELYPEANIPSLIDVEALEAEQT